MGIFDRFRRRETSGLTFQREHLPRGHGADDYESDEGDAYTIHAYQGQTPIGSLDYNHIPEESRIRLRWLETNPKQQGTGTALLEHLKALHPDHEIETGGLTAEGQEFWDRRMGNILDPVSEELDPSVWDNPADPKPKLKPEHDKWIRDRIEEALAKYGYEDADKWLSLVLTGSLTTYQYAPHSDCDVSLWIDAEKLPEWSRAEMIGIMVSEFDAVKLPGTTHDLQAFVVSPKLAREDLYQPGLRSAYDIDADKWVVPPDKTRSHDVEREMNELYTQALESLDKVERLLKYEPDKATLYYRQLHRRRQRDMNAGRGDFTASNIAWKMFESRGIANRIHTLIGTDSDV